MAAAVSTHTNQPKHGREKLSFFGQKCAAASLFHASTQSKQKSLVCSGNFFNILLGNIQPNVIKVASVAGKD
jgi:hypothetical protein